MREKDFQTIFGKHNKQVGVFELKLVKLGENGKFPPLPFKAVAECKPDGKGNLRPSQLDNLLAVSYGDGLYHKISDSFVGTSDGQRRFPSQKPFDCFFLKGIQAYVVICYYIPRAKKEFIYIHADIFEREMIESDRKSLTYERAEEIMSYRMMV